MLNDDVWAAIRSPEATAAAHALPDVRGTLILPLRERGQAFGALVLTAETPHAFDPAELAFYGTLAAEVALVLDNARLYANNTVGRQRLQAIFDHSPDWQAAIS